MKIQYKHQKFQQDAANAVCNVFAGQPHRTFSYNVDYGSKADKDGIMHTDAFIGEKFIGFKNSPIAPELRDEIILDNINKIQRSKQIPISDELEGRYNLTIEMETGVGKTYTYIKTMYELNKRYGWNKFIVVVPSVAIREGVYKSFETTQDHFAQDYENKIRFFIYNSQKLHEIEDFAKSEKINVMIINTQAFNATGKDARRIYMKLDEFRSRRPIDIIASTNPILIIDEPQSVDGPETKKKLKEFKPLFTLRYSATHKKDSIYNMIYRLDAMEAYNKKLVKRIAVKGITYTGSTATEGYVYVQRIELSASKPPVATIEFDKKGTKGIQKVTRKVNEGYNLYPQSGELSEYKNNYIVAKIDGRDNSVEFLNGKKIYVGNAIGEVNEDQLRRIQIRETIISHLEREQQLFHKHIKVLSLFFIDEVAKYKQYDDSNTPFNGVYADIFEQEYDNIVLNMQAELSEDYKKYLNQKSAASIHAGYFSIDKTGKTKGRIIDSKKERGKTESADKDAYDLIMKNKERLLDIKEPVRFIFSHSALREGWDNPNVFQICTLKQSKSDVRKRQEVGRGLRLAVNQMGERMDETILKEDVHSINVLTVIANESYDEFAAALQKELAEDIANRPQRVTTDLFKGKYIKDQNGNEQIIDDDMAHEIFNTMIKTEYIDTKGYITDKYRNDRDAGKVIVADCVSDCIDSIIEIMNSVFDPKAMALENAFDDNVTLKVRKEMLGKPEFIALWNKINAKSTYTVAFSDDELVKKAVTALDAELRVEQIFIKVDGGTLEEIKSKGQLAEGKAFIKNKIDHVPTLLEPSQEVKYDLVGRIATETELTRKTVVKILTKIQPDTFNQFKTNPEDFIIKTCNIINDQKATLIVQHVIYDKLDDKYHTDIFTEPTIKGQIGKNVIPANKHLYDHILFDSNSERRFAESLDLSSDISVYVKLPKGFYISTPVGNYNPDWAIAFQEGTVKHIYFVAETKGSMNSLQLRDIEKAKIDCAKRHFAVISSEPVKYEVVDSYEALMHMVK